MSGSDTSGTITTNQTPAWLQAKQQDLLNRADAISQQPYEAYTGQTVAGLAPGQTQAIGGLQNTAQTVSNLDPASNPMWAVQAKNIGDQYAKYTAPQTNAAFARSGAFGGTAYNDAVQGNQKALGDSLAGLSANLYNTGIQNSLNANNALLQGAGVQQQNTQAGLTDAYQRWQQEKLFPAGQLDILGNAVNIAGGGNGISQSTQNTGGK